MINGKIKVIIDTNLFIKASMSDSEYENITYLIQLAKKNKIQFLIFEIVIDELVKYSSNLESTLQVEISKASKAVRDALSSCKLWNELNDLNDFLNKCLDDYHAKKYNKSQNFIVQIKALVESKKIKLIAPNYKGYYEIERKINRGEAKRINSNDLHIIEVLKEQARKFKDSLICFVTENKNDFFKYDENGNLIKNEDGSLILANEDESCKNVLGFSSLKQVIRFIDKELGDKNE